MQKMEPLILSVTVKLNYLGTKKDVKILMHSKNLEKKAKR